MQQPFQSAVSNEQSATSEVRPTNTARVEAFSDGVMAIAITLLVLEIRLRAESGESPLSSTCSRSWGTASPAMV